MIAICFFWDPPAAIARQSQAAKKFLLHWTQVGKAFGVREFYCISIPEERPAVGIDVDFTFIDSLDALPNRPHVYVEQGGVSIEDFEHPDDCIYVFGSDYGQLDRADVAIASDLGLYADQACAIILHDRRVKRGCNQ